MCSTSIPFEKMYEILFFLAKRAFYLENGDIDRSTDNSLQIRKYKAKLDNVFFLAASLLDNAPPTR